MRAIIIAAIVIGAMATMGWLNFSNSDGAASATFDKNKAAQDTAEAKEKAKEVAEEGAEVIRNAVDDVRRAIDKDESVPANAPKPEESSGEVSESSNSEAPVEETVPVESTAQP